MMNSKVKQTSKNMVSIFITLKNFGMIQMLWKSKPSQKMKQGILLLAL